MTLEVALFSILGVLIVFEFGRALLTGRTGWGRHAIDRSEAPDRFRFQVSLLVLMAVVLAIQASFADRHLPIAGLVLGVMTAHYFVRALITREALDPAFSRSDEPVQYWALVLILLAASVFLIGDFIVAFSSTVA